MCGRYQGGTQACCVRVHVCMCLPCQSERLSQGMVRRHNRAAPGRGRPWNSTPPCRPAAREEEEHLCIVPRGRLHARTLVQSHVSVACERPFHAGRRSSRRLLSTQGTPEPLGHASAPPPPLACRQLMAVCRFFSSPSWSIGVPQVVSRSSSQASCRLSSSLRGTQAEGHQLFAQAS